MEAFRPFIAEDILKEAFSSLAFVNLAFPFVAARFRCHILAEALVARYRRLR